MKIQIEAKCVGIESDHGTSLRYAFLPQYNDLGTSYRTADRTFVLYIPNSGLTIDKTYNIEISEAS